MSKFTEAIFEKLESNKDENNAKLATFGDETIGLLHHAGTYYLFDSHARSLTGSADPFGSAILLEFPNLEALTNHLTVVYDQAQFELTSYTFHQTPTPQNASCTVRTPMQ